MGNCFGNAFGRFHHGQVPFEQLHRWTARARVRAIL